LEFELRSVDAARLGTEASPERAADAEGRLPGWAEPPVAIAANLRWNLRTRRVMPPADLYHLHSYNQYGAVRRMAHRSDAPYIYDAHDAYWEAELTIDADHRSGLTRAYFQRREARCVAGAVELTTVSDGVAGLLRERYGRTPLVFRNFQDPRLDRPSPRDIRRAAGVLDSDFLLAMVGNAKPGDAIAEAVEALGMLPDRVHLALVGRGHEGFLAAAARHGVDGRVHILPPVPPDQVTDFIAAADASPILYRAWTRNFEHAMPNRFSHAIAAGLPVLYPPLTEIRALSERHGLGLEIDPTDPGSIAAAVRRLSEDRAELDRLRKNVRAAAPELSWEREEERIAAMLDAALAGGAAA
jgi:glycosyltransferase involved in cell wall biosynthesis